MKPLAISTLLLLTAGTSQSQPYFYNEQYLEPKLLLEAGAMAGGMYALTDLGAKKDRGRLAYKNINFSQIHFCHSFFLQATDYYGVSFRLQLTAGSVSAADSLIRGGDASANFRIQRNLHFKSRITEMQGLFCWEPLTSFGNRSISWSPYLIAGIGIFRFNPKAVWNNQWIALQPLRTEGQGFDEYPERRVYKLTQIQFPAGLGVRYEISARLAFRIEYVYRFLTTDYLDDVSTNYVTPISFGRNLDPSTAELARRLSDRRYRGNDRPVSPNAQRGNPGSKDSYFSCTAGLGYVLNRKKR